MTNPDLTTPDLSFSKFAPVVGNSLGGLISATFALRNGAVDDPDFSRDLLVEMDHHLNVLKFLYTNWALSSTRLQPRAALQHVSSRPSAWLVEQLPVLQKVFPARPVSWSVSIPSDLPEASFDRELLAQALVNLAFIAVAQARPGSKILLSAGSDHGALMFQIGRRDPAGSGPHEADRSFARALKPVWTLGARVVAQIAAAHGGRLEAGSTGERQRWRRIVIPNKNTLHLSVQGV